ATEIYDYLRLLFARIGQSFCLQCGAEVRRDTVDEVAAAVLAMGDGTRLNVFFPLQSQNGVPPPPVPAKKKSRSKQTGVAPASRRQSFEAVSDAIKSRLFDLRKRGFNRLYQNGQIFEFSTPESLLDINFAEPVYLLVDRLAVSAEARARIVDAIEIGFRESGEVIFESVPPDGEVRQR